MVKWLCARGSLLDLRTQVGDASSPSQWSVDEVMGAVGLRRYVLAHDLKGSVGFAILSLALSLLVPAALTFHPPSPGCPVNGRGFTPRALVGTARGQDRAVRNARRPLALADCEAAPGLRCRIEAWLASGRA